jgi:2'-5' RNA ligase
MRLFIAIEIPARLRAKLHQTGCGLAESVPSVRPMGPEGIHLTLHFLGDLEEARIPLLSRVIDAAASSHCRFTAAVAGVGTFGRHGSPSVVWAGVEPAAGLMGIHMSLAQGLAGLEMQVDEREYRPHITIARVKPGLGMTTLCSLVEELAGETFGEIDAGSIALVKSTLSRSGAVYETIRTALLSQ